MSTKRVRLTVEVSIALPDGAELPREGVKMRVRRLLDEYESARSQPDDFYLTEPTVISIQPVNRKRLP